MFIIADHASTFAAQATAASTDTLKLARERIRARSIVRTTAPVCAGYGHPDGMDHWRLGAIDAELSARELADGILQKIDHAKATANR